MSGGKHTPGPWTVEQGPHGRIHVVAGKLGRIATVHGYGIGEHRIRRDACVMAAAPELLDALKDAHAALRYHPGGDTRPEANIDRAKWAITVAEGGCLHPGPGLINVRRLSWTGGPDKVWVADCTACGERDVRIDEPEWPENGRQNGADVQELSHGPNDGGRAS